MSTNLQNSIWPNAGGTLGQIKVQIPTGTTNDPWPTGDALIGNFVFNKGKLVGFVDTKALIANSSKSTIFPYEYVNISLPFIAEGEMTYNYDQCTYVILNGEVLKGDIPTDGELEIITKKYAGCKTILDIEAVDPNYFTNDIVNGVWSEGLGDLENGANMFEYRNLASIASDLTSLKYGGVMFKGTYLTYFDIDLPKLESGYEMFLYCYNLTTFSPDLPSLTDGRSMFCYCKNLKSFSHDLLKLTNGSGMFCYCENLASFTSALSSLTNGYDMFQYCKLDTESLVHIAETIKDVKGLTNGDGYWHDIYKTIYIGIGKDSLSGEDESYLQQIRDKGWSVYATCNGYPNGSDSGSGYYGTAASASLTTLDEMGESEMFNPKPYWAKPFNTDEQHARYVDSEGNFYNILGAQYIYVDDPDTYGMFINEDDAAAQMRLTKIEKK